jgi:hypothetical protein
MDKNLETQLTKNSSMNKKCVSAEKKTRFSMYIFCKCAGLKGCFILVWAARGGPPLCTWGESEGPAICDRLLENYLSAKKHRRFGDTAFYEALGKKGEAEKILRGNVGAARPVQHTGLIAHATCVGYHAAKPGHSRSPSTSPTPPCRRFFRRREARVV